MVDSLLNKQFSASDFIESRPELPDMGQWAELHMGAVKLLEVPDEIHGRVVLNLSKAIASFMQQSAPGICPVFDIGLMMSAEPDTVWFPALSVFPGSPFSHTDLNHTDDTPDLVVEIASTNDRRQKLRSRILSYHERGVETVWAIDPDEERVNVLPRGEQTRAYDKQHELLGSGPLADFAISVSQLFAQPEWYR